MLTFKVGMYKKRNLTNGRISKTSCSKTKDSVESWLKHYSSYLPCIFSLLDKKNKPGSSRVMQESVAKAALSEIDEININLPIKPNSPISAAKYDFVAFCPIIVISLLQRRDDGDAEWTICIENWQKRN